MDEEPGLMPSHEDEHHQIIGRIICAYNMLESWHKSLFWLCIPKQPEESAIIASLLSYESIDKSIDLLLVPKQASKTAEAILDFLKMASICRANRNVIAHSLSNTMPTTDMLSAFKADVRKPGLGAASIFDSAGLWEMDEGIRQVAWYGMGLFHHIWADYVNARLIPGVDHPVSPFPLPDRPLPPRTWTQIRVGPTLDRIQPQSSRQ